jgi:hypothetical protein
MAKVYIYEDVKGKRFLLSSDKLKDDLTQLLFAFDEAGVSQQKAVKKIIKFLKKNLIISEKMPPVQKDLKGVAVFKAHIDIFRDSFVDIEYLLKNSYVCF